MPRIAGFIKIQHIKFCSSSKSRKQLELIELKLPIKHNCTPMVRRKALSELLLYLNPLLPSRKLH
ncbi:hypothetical protein ACU8KH_01224 [Lachancea thermotolerans]